MLLARSPVNASLGSFHSPLGNFFFSSNAGGLPEAASLPDARSVRCPRVLQGPGVTDATCLTLLSKVTAL